MKRKDFLKITSGLALSLVSRGWAGEGSSLLPDGPGSSSGVPKKGFLGESRRLGGLEVSPIGLGCLPMVGYYGGKYDKQEMIALIRRKCTGLIPVRNGWGRLSPLSATRSG